MRSRVSRRRLNARRESRGTSDSRPCTAGRISRPNCCKHCHRHSRVKRNWRRPQRILNENCKPLARTKNWWPDCWKSARSNPREIHPSSISRAACCSPRSRHRTSSTIPPKSSIAWGSNFAATELPTCTTNSRMLLEARKFSEAVKVLDDAINEPSLKNNRGILVLANSSTRNGGRHRWRVGRDR